MRKIKQEEQMKIYEYTQNNSGGSFMVDSKLCHRLFIEAKTQKEADLKALDMGVYFNGCDDDIDCPCCGDRWHEGSEVEVPVVYDKKRSLVFSTIEGYAQHLADGFGWTSPEARIFFADGSVKEVYKQSK